MRKFIFLNLIMILLCGLPLFADEGKAVFVQGSVKIGYVDFERALNEVKDGVAAKKRLKDEFKEKQQKLNNIQKELSALKKDIDKNQLGVAEKGMNKQEQEYRTKFYEMQQKMAAFQREMENRENTLTRQILDNLRNIVKNIGEKEKYSLILEKSQDVVLYAPRCDDITQEVIASYNADRSR